MSTIELLPSLGKPNAEQASAWIAAALAEAAALRRYDNRLFARSSESAEIESCKKVHAVWRKWADQAEAVLAHVRPLLDEGQKTIGVDDLESAVMRARAMLQLTPEGQARALEQARRGEGVDGREMRREVERRKAELARSGSRA